MKMRTLLITFLLAFTFAAAAGQSAKPPFSIDISAPTIVKAGVPIEIKVLLTNTSDHSIDFNAHEPEELNYRTEVFKSDGRPEDYTTHGQFLATGSCKVQEGEAKGAPSCIGNYGPPVRVSLRPSGKYITWIDVTEQFRLNKPGDYSIRVSRSTAGNPENRIAVKSNMITVTVTP
jgi:hypothetical protein